MDFGEIHFSFSRIFETLHQDYIHSIVLIALNTEVPSIEQKTEGVKVKRSLKNIHTLFFNVTASQGVTYI